MTRLMMLALVLTPLTSMAASPLAFNFNCASIGGVNSDGKGNVWIDGGKATVKAFNENYWEATSGKNTVSISRKDDGNPDVSWTGPNRKHGVCLPEDNIDYSPAKNRPTQVRLTPALLFKREVRKILFARAHRSLQWI